MNSNLEFDKVPISLIGGVAVNKAEAPPIGRRQFCWVLEFRLYVSRRLCEIICWLGQDGGYSVFSSFLSMEYIRPLRLCRIVLTPQVSVCCLQIEQRVSCRRYGICQVSDPVATLPSALRYLTLKHWKSSEFLLDWRVSLCVCELCAYTFWIRRFSFLPVEKFIF
jgi:hypothetical protein